MQQAPENSSNEASSASDSCVAPGGALAERRVLATACKKRGNARLGEHCHCANQERRMFSHPRVSVTICYLFLPCDIDVTAGSTNNISRLGEFSEFPCIYSCIFAMLVRSFSRWRSKFCSVNAYGYFGVDWLSGFFEDLQVS